MIKKSWGARVTKAAILMLLLSFVAWRLYAIIPPGTSQQHEVSSYALKGCHHFASESPTVFTSSSTSTWATYLDHRFRFSFKYPINWKIIPVGSDNSGDLVKHLIIG